MVLTVAIPLNLSIMNSLAYSLSSGQSVHYKNSHIKMPVAGKLITIKIINIPAWMREDNLKEMLRKLKPTQPLTLDFKELMIAACR
jgi:hypothetical protein